MGDTQEKKELAAEQSKIVIPNTMEFQSKNGNDYLFTKVLPSDWMDMIDRTNNAGPTGGRSTKEMYQGVLDLCVLKPGGLKINDFHNKPEFNGMEELSEVATAARRFQQGS